MTGRELREATLVDLLTEQFLSKQRYILRLILVALHSVQGEGRSMENFMSWIHNLD